jgi:bacteriorhodopsin
VAACIFCETVVYYSLLATGLAAHECIVPLGGASTESVRLHSIGRYVYWLCSTPPLVAMMGELGGASPSGIARAVVADIVMVLSGLLASSEDR